VVARLSYDPSCSHCGTEVARKGSWERGDNCTRAYPLVVVLHRTRVWRLGGGFAGLRGRGGAPSRREACKYRGCT